MLRAILYISVFLVCVSVCAKVRSRSVRQIILLLSSYLLYSAWEPWFLCVLVFSTVMNFLIGRSLRKQASGVVLTLGIALNLALLCSFKYFPPIALSLPVAWLQSLAHVVVPLGISFWTFQAMSYLFDLYRGDELDPTLIEFALYMAFFPITISGPVCRMPEMLPQFRNDRLTAVSEIGRGLARIAVGILMMQIAKLLGQGILAGDGVIRGFDRPTAWSGADVWCLAFGYGLQLFFDFAGYSHIAIGAAQALGVTVPENFERPFASTTPSIFWTRWHMSLSFWIRDYVFFPLATMRRSLWWRNSMLVLSMIVFGVWHQATILFVLWGLYHGILLVLHRQIERLERTLNWEPPQRIWNSLSWLVTICLVNLGWILFRANSLQQASKMFRSVVTPADYFFHFLSGSLYGLVAFIAAGYALTLLIADALAPASDAEERESQWSMVRWLARSRWYWVPALYLLTLAIVVLVTRSRDVSAAQFMYRRF